MYNTYKVHTSICTLLLEKKPFRIETRVGIDIYIFYVILDVTNLKKKKKKT